MVGHKRAITWDEHCRIVARECNAERAKVAGYPERFAQLALGHNSKAVHRAYAKRAQVTLPPLEDYEKNMAAVIFPLAVSVAG